MSEVDKLNAEEIDESASINRALDKFVFSRESSEDIPIKDLIEFLQRLDKNGHTHVDVWTDEWELYAEGNQPIEIYPVGEAE